MILLLNCSCDLYTQHYSDTADSFTVVGRINQFPATMIYLSEGARPEHFLDSAKVQNGQFVFNIKHIGAFIEPGEVCLVFKDARDELNQIVLNCTSATGKSFLLGSFYSNEDALIEGRIENIDHHLTNPLSIKGGPETSLHFQYPNFGMMTARSQGERQEKVASFIHLVKTHDASYCLLQQLFNYRRGWKSSELEDFYMRFNTELKQSRTGQALKQYIERLKKPASTLSSYTLPMIDSTNRHIIDSGAKLNLLVFWASWCVPCRRELPFFEKLHQQYGNKGLTVSSISFDANEDAWRKAVAKDQPSWRQFIAGNATADSLCNELNFVELPTVVLLDHRGIILHLSRGFDSRQQAAQSALIKQLMGQL
jgi:thiol-disulfide isomerase/thioredoxin